MPNLLEAIGANDAAALRTSLNAMVSLPLFLPSLYLIFAIANTMLPTRQELTSIGFMWFVPVVFFAVLGLIGLWGGIVLVVERWVTPVLARAHLCVRPGPCRARAGRDGRVVRGARGRAGDGAAGAVRAARTPGAARKGRLPEPASVRDLRLPVPPPPGTALPARKTAAELEAGETRVRHGSRSQSAPGFPREPAGTPRTARARYRDRLPVPAPPVKAAPPAPAPARPLPGQPPPRLGAGVACRDFDEEELSDEELDALTAPPKPGGPAPLRPPSATPIGSPRPATGDARRAEPLRPAGAPSPSPLSPAARGAGGQGGSGTPSRPGAPAAGGFGGQGTRPGQPAEVGRRPASPSAPASRDLERPARPAPKPISSIGQPRSPASAENDDFIDADVIDEEAIDLEDEEKPAPRPILGTPQPAGSTRGGSPFAPRREDTPKSSGPAPIGGQQRRRRRPVVAPRLSPSESSSRPMGRPVSDLFCSKPRVQPAKTDDEADNAEDEDIRYDPLDDTP